MSEFVTSAVLWLAPAPPTRNPSGEARGAEQLKARAADRAGMTIAGATARPACHAVSGWPARAAAGVGLAWSRNDSQAPDVLIVWLTEDPPIHGRAASPEHAWKGRLLRCCPGAGPSHGDGRSAPGPEPGRFVHRSARPLLGWGAACKAAPARQPPPEGTICATQGPRVGRSPGRPGRPRRRPPAACLDPDRREPPRRPGLRGLVPASDVNWLAGLAHPGGALAGHRPGEQEQPRSNGSASAPASYLA